MPTKPSLVCVNQIDLWNQDELESWKAELGEDFLFVSAKDILNLDDIRKFLVGLDMEKRVND